MLLGLFIYVLSIHVKQGFMESHGDPSGPRSEDSDGILGDAGTSYGLGFRV